MLSGVCLGNVLPCEVMFQYSPPSTYASSSIGKSMSYLFFLLSTPKAPPRLSVKLLVLFTVPEVPDPEDPEEGYSFK